MKIIDKDLYLETTYDFMARFSEEQPLFIDIETTGLSPERSHVYLVGCIEPLGGERWHFIQWLAESPLEERRLLGRVNEYVQSYSLLVHFNGDRFDLPYLQQRCGECGIDGVFLRKRSLDLYKEFKKCKGLCGLANGKQKTFESFLGIGREDQYDGGRLIPVYHDFVRTGREDLEHLLLIHNEEDVIGMTKLLPMFAYVELLEGDSALLAAPPVRLPSPRVNVPFGREAGESVSPAVPTEFLLFFPLRCCYPARLSFHTDEGWYGILSGDSLRLKVPGCQGELRYYLPNPRDYYYLPAEDTVVHKSVGEYVDRAYRRQATAKNCYIKKSGSFLLLPEAMGEPVFYCDDRKTAFREWTEDLPADLAFWEEYLRKVIRKRS